MTRRLPFAIVSLLVVLLAAGCGAVQPTPPPAVATRLAEMDQRNERLPGRYGIFLASTDMAEIEQIYGGNRLRSNMRVSPDGQWVTYIEYTKDENGDGVIGENDYKAAEIGVMQIDGSDARLLTTNENVDISPTWSPDGDRIMFASDTGNEEFRLDLFVMDLNGENVVNVTNTPDVVESDPSWAGENVAFVRVTEADKYQTIWLMDCDPEDLVACGENARQFTTPLAEGQEVSYVCCDFTPRLSPDGTVVAFHRHQNEDWSIGNTPIGDWDVVTKPVDGGPETIVSQGTEADLMPAWSPDAERFVVRTIAPGSEDNIYENVNDLVVMDVDGGNRQKVEGELDLLFEHVADWVPAGALDDNEAPWLIFSAEWWDGNPEHD